MLDLADSLDKITHCKLHRSVGLGRAVFLGYLIIGVIVAGIIHWRGPKWSDSLSSMRNSLWWFLVITTPLPITFLLQLLLWPLLVALFLLGNVSFKRKR
jgi:hypothetical protein